MNEIPTIEERLVTYYNDLVKNNVIPGKAPITLEWLKRQRIVEGRNELDIRFGHETVNKVLGEKTPLAKAEQYLNEVRDDGKYELLPEIAKLLAKECTEMLGSDNVARRKYSSLDKYVSIHIVDIPDTSITLGDMLFTSRKEIQLYTLVCINNFIFKHNNINDSEYSDVCFSIYIRELVYITLLEAFNEISKQIDYITKN